LTGGGPTFVISELDIRYRERMGVYPVREDSYLLLRALKPILEKGTGMFLDMGCGLGIASVLASSRGWKVL